MKLHLNLTLRRALMAAMAMVALHTADAGMAPTYGHMYVTGEVTPTTTEWTTAWGSTQGVLSVGTSAAAGTLTLTSGNYTTPNSIFLGGKGYDSNGTEAKNGTLNIGEGATLTVNGSTNVGNSQIGGIGTLTLDDGTLNAGNTLYVGVNAGRGTIEADGSTITVASGSTGAVFAMSHRNISGLADTVTLNDSSITVGAAGGVRDYTGIGHSIGTATLNLKAGSTATFHDQTIVGEMGGSNGTINVTGGSTLNLGTVTVLGKEAGAKGKICIEGDDSILTADELVIGDKGIGIVEVTATANDDWEDTFTISAKEITLGESAGGSGTLSIGEAATVGEITNLRVGLEGIGTLTTETDIKTDTLAIAQSGSSVTVKNYSKVDTGYLSILGGTLNIADVDENENNTDGYVYVSGATLTDAGSTINIAVGGLLSTQGGSSEINGATIENTVIGGNVNIDGSGSNDGKPSYGSWNAKGSTTMLGTLANDGVLNVGTTNVAGSMAALQGITGIGATNVAEGSTLELTGVSSQNEIDNDGSITLLSNATLTSGSLTGTGTTNVAKDSKLQLAGDSSQNKIVNDGVLNVGITDDDGEVLQTGTMAALQGITGIGTTNVAEGSELQLTGDSSQNKIVNKGVLNVGITDDDGKVLQTGIMAALQGITGTTGTTNVAEGSKLELTGASSQNKIVNNGSITLRGAGSIDATTLSGTGTTTIAVDKTTVNGTVVDLELAPENKDAVKVTLDMSNTAGLVGKDLTFLSIGTLDTTADDTNDIDISLVNADQKSTGINWTDSYIDINGTSNKLWFTSDYEDNAVSKMKFTKLAELIIEEDLGEITYIDPDTKEEKTASTSVTLDYEKQTLAHEEKTLDADKEIDTDLAAAIGVTTGSTTSAPILQTVSIDNASITADTTAGDGEAKIGIVVGAGVDSTSLTVQTVVVKQVTKDKDGKVLSEEAIDSTGMALVLEGTSTHEGKGDQKNNHLGFADELNGKEISTNDGETKKTQTIDLVQVGSNASVTLTKLNMHSTHTLEVKKGATLTFNGVNMKVGGGIDTAIKTETVQVEVKDEKGNVLKDSKGNIITKEVTVENKNTAHLDTGSVIGDTETDPDKATETKVVITGGSVVEFEKVRSADDKVELGTTTITGAKTEVVMDGEDTTLGMDSVVKEKDDQGKDKEKHGQKIVFSNGSHLKGNGNLKNIHIDKDSYFTVGSSPGKFSASELTVDGKTSFYIITDSNEWLDYAKTNTLSADKRQDGAAPGNWGAISQLEVKGSVTLNGQVTFIYQHFDDAAGKFVTEDTATAREKMKQYFKEGSSIKFVDFGQDGNLTLGSNFSVDVASLPELEDGLFWDVNSLFTENTVYVMAEILEEPSRIANSLVSAGETVLNFGRLAQKQASLREAGTTRTWGSAIAMFDSIDSGSTTNGYDYSNWGAAVGIDHAFTKNTVVGVAFGCTWGENEAKEDNGYYSAGSIDQDAKMIGIYGVHKFQTKGLLNDVKLSAFAAYGMFENDSTRNGLNSGNTAKAEWDSDAWVLSASLSRDITTDSGVVFTPYVGVEYTTAGMDDFSEQGKSYAADYSADEDYSNLSVKVGVGVSKTYGSITPYANVAFISDIDRTAGEVTATGKRTITGKSALPGRNGFEIGVGATWQLTENLDVNAGYSAEIRDKASEHNARLGVGYTF